MNVIVSNRQKEIIDNANIDAIKDLNGLFNVDDLINKFKNYFFSKMILDATSIVNFASREVLTKLVDEIGAEKLIILLPVNPDPPEEFKKLLIDLKIYNFTNRIEDVVKFIEKPNAYEDIIKTLDSGSSDEMYVDNSIKEGEDTSDDNEEDQVNDISPIGENNNGLSGQSLDAMLNNFNLQGEESNHESTGLNETELQYDQGNEEEHNDVETEEKREFNYDLNSVINDSVPSNENHQNTFLISDAFVENDNNEKMEKKVIGFKNVTLHAGSTSLIYMLHKIVSVNMKKRVLSIELDKQDFKYYRDNKMISANRDNISEIIEKATEEIIFIDLNENDNVSFCTDIIYLVEPSTIMLNKLMMENKNIFKELSNKKVVLNKSLLLDNDIRTLSSEAGMGFFYNIEPLNDRIFNETIAKFLGELGIK